MLRQDRHIQLQQKFQVLDNFTGPLARYDAVETVAADIRSLIKTFVEELHERRTFQRQDGRARRRERPIGKLEWHLAAGPGIVRSRERPDPKLFVARFTPG